MYGRFQTFKSSKKFRLSFSTLFYNHIFFAIANRKVVGFAVLQIMPFF